MKKILFHLFLLASLFMAACHDDNGGPSSIVIDKDQQNQTAYADDTEKTIRFEATEACIPKSTTQQQKQRKP